jgi:hypothetical protein
MRVATAMRDVHYVLHAPQGDTYADLLFTMIERLSKRPPVTYTTFQARDLGGDHAHVRAGDERVFAAGHVAAHEQQGEKSYLVIPHTFYT